MSDVATADTATPRMADLNVSGHLMTLEPGLFCIVQLPAAGADPGIFLPGVRVSLPPGPSVRPDHVQIGGLRDDGWLSAQGDAALVRVSGEPAQILVTIYKSAVTDVAPSLQVMRLLDPAAGTPAPITAAPRPAPAAPAAPRPQEMVAHVQSRGDVGAMLGEWLGERGSERWIEGFAVSPTHDITAADIEYQAVLGRGWLSPWAEGGQFCGSRGMALPVLGLRVRLREAAERDYECLCSATFVDGTAIGPVPAGQACEAESLAPLEAFQIVVRRRGGPAEADAKSAAKPTRSATSRKR